MTQIEKHKITKRLRKGRYYRSAKNTYSVSISNVDFIKRWLWEWESLYEQRVIVEED